MAIDTQNKRRSVQAYSFGLMRSVADAVVGVDDRKVCAWLYFSESPSSPLAWQWRNMNIGIGIWL